MNEGNNSFNDYNNNNNTIPKQYLIIGAITIILVIIVGILISNNKKDKEESTSEGTKQEIKLTDEQKRKGCKVCNEPGGICCPTIQKEEYDENGCIKGYKFSNLVGLCYGERIPATKACKDELVDGDYRKGTLIQAGRSPAYCGYIEMSTFLGQEVSCQNNNGSYSRINNRCYRVIKMENTDNSCPEGYTYYKPLALDLDLEQDGCFKTMQKR